MLKQLRSLVARARSSGASNSQPFLGQLEIYRGLEFWLSSPDMAARLKEIDRRIATTAPRDVPMLWRGIPFDVFSLLAFHRPPQYPNLRDFFPDWPSPLIQAQTVGAHGTKLEFMTNAFIRSLVRGAQQNLTRDLSEARVLDYGVGFGRNVRMLSKYVPVDQLYGVDPFPPNIEICRQIGLKAHVHLCESYPQTLPAALAGTRFDLIFLFSIFTHLSEPTHLRVLKVVHEGLADDGVLAVTIRPREAWDVVETAERERLMRAHDAKGFAFQPIDITELGQVDGEPTFGETTLSLKYVEDHWTDWQIVDMDLNLIDPYQLILFLKKKPV